MGPPFSIQFDFPIAHSNSTILLKAVARLHRSEPYYVVGNFQFADGKGPHSTSILPPQEIKVLKKGKVNTWVHRDSGRESLLSRAIGKAIEDSDKNR